MPTYLKYGATFHFDTPSPSLTSIKQESPITPPFNQNASPIPIPASAKFESLSPPSSELPSTPVSCVYRRHTQIHCLPTTNLIWGPPEPTPRRPLTLRRWSRQSTPSPTLSSMIRAAHRKKKQQPLIYRF